MWAPAFGRAFSSVAGVRGVWLVSVVLGGQHEAFDGDVGVDVLALRNAITLRPEISSIPEVKSSRIVNW